VALGPTSEQDVVRQFAALGDEPTAAVRGGVPTLFAYEMS
jgi:hypothetical protein